MPRRIEVFRKKRSLSTLLLDFMSREFTGCFAFQIRNFEIPGDGGMMSQPSLI